MLNTYLPLAEAISKLLYPFAEIVIHDLATDEVHAIFNPISKREVGDRSYLDSAPFDKKDCLPDIIGPYEKMNFDGRKLKSISVVIKGEDNNAVGFLCINLDISVFDKYKTILDAFLTTTCHEMSKSTQALFKDDLYEKINAFVQQYCLARSLSVETLGREDKKKLIMALQDEGALEGKNASQYIARTLGVSRATVYNYLNKENK